MSFERYRSAIINSTHEGDPRTDALLMDRHGDMAMYYCPFDYVNPDAKVVIVGITPGKTQMRNALAEARQQLMRGKSEQEALIAAKRTGAFSGAMRSNLVALLDHIGIHRWLSISTCADFFSPTCALAQTASVLRYPVFKSGADYNGNPSMTGHPFLQRYAFEYFGKEAASLKEAVFVPVGTKVAEALTYLSHKGFLCPHRILDGLPHPSGANAERISYFLGKKRKQDLSAKTDAVRLDAAKDHLSGMVRRLQAPS
jgi:hypothetical protein